MPIERRRTFSGIQEGAAATNPIAVGTALGGTLVGNSFNGGTTDIRASLVPLLISEWNANAAVTDTTGQADPFGGANAVKMIETVANSDHESVFNLVSGFAASGEQIAVQGYIKNAVGTRWVYVNLETTGLVDSFFYFQPSSGAIGISGGGLIFSVQNIGNGWFFFTATLSGQATAIHSIGVGLADVNGGFTYVGDGVSGVFIYGIHVTNPDTLERVRMKGIAAAGGGTFVVTIPTNAPPYTDQITRVRARTYFTHFSASHLDSGAKLECEAEIQNANNTVTFTSALAGSANPLNSNTAGEAAAFVQVASANMSLATAIWSIVANQLTLTITNNAGAGSVQATITVVLEIERSW